jgi:hypothetical protein
VEILNHIFFRRVVEAFGDGILQSFQKTERGDFVMQIFGEDNALPIRTR